MMGNGDNPYPGLRMFFRAQETEGPLVYSTGGFSARPKYDGRGTGPYYPYMSFGVPNAVTFNWALEDSISDGLRPRNITSGNFLVAAVIGGIRGGNGFKEASFGFGWWGASGTKGGWLGWLRSGGGVDSNNYPDPGTGAEKTMKVDFGVAAANRQYGYFNGSPMLDGTVDGGPRVMIAQGTIDAVNPQPVKVSYDGMPVVDANIATTRVQGLIPSIDFDQNGCFTMEAGDLYGSFIYGLGSKLYTDAELLSIASWCKTNWVAGNKTLPPQLLGVGYDS